MKNLLTIALILIAAISAHAQQAPGNNLGKSLYTMKHEFPELRYIRTEEKGILYEDGYPEDGIALFFYFRNNEVIEECMICESTDDFAKIWFNSMWKSFSSKYPYAIKNNTYNSKLFNFSTFKVHLIFYSENGKNTALIVYDR